MKCHVFVDRTRCKACGACMEICPQVFQHEPGSEKAQEVCNQVPHSATLEQAVSICPTHCIELECPADG